MTVATDQTEHRTPLDLAAIRSEYLVQCGPCDFGVMSACTCPPGDIRAVLQRALDEVEQLRALFPEEVSHVG